MFVRESSLIAYILAAIDLTVSLVASVHVILFKRDTRAAASWIGLIWLSPIVGSTLYVLLGVNRIQRKAKTLLRDRPHAPPAENRPISCSLLEDTLGPESTHLATLNRLVEHLAGTPLLGGNDVEPLDGGKEAYPAMLRAIDDARMSVVLSTYILNSDRVGLQIIDSLARAVTRGVEVRVLIDDFGSRNRWPSAVRRFRNAGVPVARFLPTLAPGWFPYLNLRNHRKILVVDGSAGFTGGMNILEEYFFGTEPDKPMRDLHFRVTGPIVTGLRQEFAEDWSFATGEILADELFAPSVAERGDVHARVVVDGPDDDRDVLLKVLLGALACARSRVAIATPYFLPDPRLISALETAALRGVEIDILLPSQNNHLVVQWASTAAVREALEGGCRVWMSPPPFDHTKLMIVDDAWSFVGSANWDPRSLRLNFELNLECYGSELATRLDVLFRERLRDSVRANAELIDGRGVVWRLRDGVARLLSPYL